MSRIPVNGLISRFQLMYREHWAYSWSGTEDGLVGCAGAFVNAYRKYGRSIYNGSNRIARSYVVELIPIGVANIVPGMAAFKVRQPGASNYALPEQYRKGGSRYNGDLGDYYHIGLVDDDPGYVLNAQGTRTGFVRSRIAENWSHVAYLKDVEYTQQEDGAMSETTDRPTWEQEPRPTIRRGAKGAAVTEAQGLLRLQGYDIAADGIFGSATEAAAKDFQTRNGLTADGIIGPATWQLLLDSAPQEDGDPEPSDEWSDMTTDEKLDNLNERLKKLESGGCA